MEGLLGKICGVGFCPVIFLLLVGKIKGTGSAELNPWVWVIKFNVLTINGNIK